MKKQLNFAVNSKVSDSPAENIHIYFKQMRKNETYRSVSIYIYIYILYVQVRLSKLCKRMNDAPNNTFK